MCKSCTLFYSMYGCRVISIWSADLKHSLLLLMPNQVAVSSSKVFSNIVCKFIWQIYTEHISGHLGLHERNLSHQRGSYIDISHCFITDKGLWSCLLSSMKWIYEVNWIEIWWLWRPFECGKLIVMYKKPFSDDLSFSTWRVILLEAAIKRWIHKGVHKGMHIVSSSTQAGCRIARY